MPYVCNKCEIQLDEEWCDECENIMSHICDIKYERCKNFHFGEGGRTTKIEYEYCDECGYFEIIN